MLVKVTKEEGFLTFISTVIALETLYIYTDKQSCGSCRVNTELQFMVGVSLLTVKGGFGLD